MGNGFSIVVLTCLFVFVQGEETWSTAWNTLDSCYITMARCEDNGEAVPGFMPKEDCNELGFTWKRTYVDSSAFKTASEGQDNGEGVYVLKVKSGLVRSSFEERFGSEVTLTDDIMYCADNSQWAFVEGKRTDIEKYSDAFEFMFYVPNALKVAPYTVDYETNTRHLSEAMGNTLRRVRIAPRNIHRARELAANWKDRHDRRRRLAAENGEESYLDHFDVHLQFPHFQEHSDYRRLEDADHLFDENEMIDELIISTRGDVRNLDVVEDEALYIEPYIHMAVTNMDAAYITQAGVNLKGNDFTEKAQNAVLHRIGVTGKGEVVGIGDSGLDDDHCMFADPGQAANRFQTRSLNSANNDLNHRKVIQYFARTDTFAGQTQDHGSHVAGSVAGFSVFNAASNADSNGRDENSFKGMAFEAKVAFFDMGRPNENSIFPPANLATQMYPFAFDVGARIHTNSWGGNLNAYTTDSRNSDIFSNRNQEMLILYANGNAGASSTGTVGTPATAKNVVSVGASMNADRSFPMSNNGNCPSRASNECMNNMARFSSNGPTSDGRIKPDVAAPGQNIGSVNSGTGCNFMFISGTSMATPVTAGSAALIRQFITEGRFVDGDVNVNAGFKPMGALVKAVLVNGAVLMDGGYQSSTVATLDNTKPGVEQGFGRIKLNNNMLVDGNTGDQLIFLDGNIEKMRQISQTGNRVRYRAPIVSGKNLDIKVTMVYHDVEGSLQGARKAVNNLDMKITDPTGKEFFPNGGNSPDPLNNVEHILIPANQVVDGDYFIEVRGQFVPQGPQQFALVFNGPVNRNNRASDGSIGEIIDEDGEAESLFGSDIIADGDNDDQTVLFIVLGAAGTVLAIGMYATIRQKRRDQANGVNRTYKKQMQDNFRAVSTRLGFGAQAGGAPHGVTPHMGSNQVYKAREQYYGQRPPQY